MNRHSFILLFILLAISGPRFVFAQSDVADTSITDTSEQSVLRRTNQILERFEMQRIADSIKRVLLEEELQKVKATDSDKKEELQQQIADLKNKEEQRILSKKARIDSLRTYVSGYPVTGFFNDTLFLIYSALGSFSPQDRALAATRRINAAGERFKVKSDSVVVIEVENTIDVIYANDILVTITENDALWNNTSREALAENYRNLLMVEFNRYKTETNIFTLAKKGGIALLVLILLWVILKYTNRLFRWTAKKIYEQKGKLIKGIKIRDYTLFDVGSEIKVLFAINKFVKWILILIIVYITLPILFGLFPWTKNLADTLFGYILNPVKKIAVALWHYLPNLFTIGVIVVLFRYLIRLIRYLKSEIELEHLKIPGFYPDFATPTFQILRVLLLAFMFVLIFPYLPGSDSPVFQGVSVFLGFLFTFGSAGSLSNVISGFVLTYMRMFKIGDRIRIGEIAGDVIEKTTLVTRIRTIKNEIVSVPNSTILNNQTVNYSSDAPDKGLILHTTVTIGYDAPWKKVHDALLEAAKRTEHLLKDPAPFVLQTSLQDYYVAYQINAYTREANKQALIYSELHKNIQDTFNENGIEILSPAYSALRDGNKIVIPDDYIGKEYESPAFRVNIKKDGPE